MYVRMIAVAAVLISALAAPAFAESADYYRGGWRTGPADPQVYEFVIRGSQVSGIACTRCSDGTTLARIEGTFSEKDGLAFTIRHLAPDGALVSEDRAKAKLGEGGLVVSGTRGDGGTFAQVATKDPRGPTPGGYQQARLPPGSPPVA